MKNIQPGDPTFLDKSLTAQYQWGRGAEKEKGGGWLIHSILPETKLQKDNTPRAGFIFILKRSLGTDGSDLPSSAGASGEEM